MPNFCSPSLLFQLSINIVPCANKHKTYTNENTNPWERDVWTHPVPTNPIKIYIQKRIEDLHQTQVQAYREAAVKGLREWAQSEASLEPMEDNDTDTAFVERCVTAILSNSSWPNWRLDSAKMVVVIEIRKRARAVFAKYHPPISNAVEETPAPSATTTTTKPTMDTTNPSKDNNNNNERDNNNDNVEDADDDGEVEDGEMDEDDQDEDGQVEDNDATKSSDNGPKRKTTNAKNKKKKVVVRKKTTNIKPGQPGQPRKVGSNNRGRRPGRGGSNAGGAKSG